RGADQVPARRAEAAVAVLRLFVEVAGAVDGEDLGRPVDAAVTGRQRADRGADQAPAGIAEAAACALVLDIEVADGVDREDLRVVAVPDVAADGEGAYAAADQVPA